MATKKDTTKKTTAKATTKAEPAPKAKAAPKAPKAPKHVVPDPMAEMSAEDFVKAAYLALLGREADAGGLRHYVQGITVHREPRESVLASLRASKEYASKNA